LLKIGYCKYEKVKKINNLIFNKNINYILLNKCHITEFGMKTNVKIVLFGEKIFAKIVEKKIAIVKMIGYVKGVPLKKKRTKG